MAIHPTAIIAPGAVLGEGVSVGPYAIIEDHVFIGDGTRIDAHAVIRAYTRMGKNNHVHPHAVVGGEPQDLKFHGEESWLEIGDENNIREFSTMHRGTEGGGGVTKIG
ncbi:MAG: acyl-[acyl-carrier-protein]--UDP-N-acetylglucosamine O-acyltransferase, partial [Deltaproteobacteria bacterium]|nr:acyl-[acyl-carrier-protein]--UDP-N-acetylglucosamine O-acyltransferase [Deltaproteobacteria bacterium]